MFDFTLEQWRLWLRRSWLWLWNMRHTKYEQHTGFLYMGKIQKMLKMPNNTFNNKATTRNAGVAAVPDWAWLCVFTWNLFPAERLLVIRAQPRPSPATFLPTSNLTDAQHSACWHRHGRGHFYIFPVELQTNSRVVWTENARMPLQGPSSGWMCNVLSLWRHF